MSTARNRFLWHSFWEPSWESPHNFFPGLGGRSAQKTPRVRKLNGTTLKPWRAPEPSPNTERKISLRSPTPPTGTVNPRKRFPPPPPRTAETVPFVQS